MDSQTAIRVAGLWASGKMIGYDETEVLQSLLAEINQLQVENEDLRRIAREQWLIAHDEHCTNMRDCSSFSSDGKECQHPLAAKMSM